MSDHHERGCYLHTHECRDCGASIWHDDVSSDECNDIPNNGQCDDCAAKELAKTAS